MLCKDYVRNSSTEDTSDRERLKTPAASSCSSSGTMWTLCWPEACDSAGVFLDVLRVCLYLFVFVCRDDVSWVQWVYRLFGSLLWSDCAVLSLRENLSRLKPSPWVWYHSDFSLLCVWHIHVCRWDLMAVELFGGGWSLWRISAVFWRKIVPVSGVFVRRI